MEKAPSPRTSLAPSSRPSLAPSTRPSLAPSSRLSLASSSRPSQASSSKPSQASSSKPSQASSSRPSQASSSRPSQASSSKPSQASSSKPSQASSSKPSQASSRPQQQPGTRVKPRGAPVVPVAPTPTQLRRLAGPEGVSTPDAPSIKNTKKLVTTCSLDGLPQRAEPPSTPASTCGGAGQQWRPQRSALPTPSGRRLSFIPTMTPRSMPRPARPAHPSCAPPGAPEQEEEEEEVFASEIQPFSLEEEEEEETAPGPPPPTQGSNQQREEKENQEKEEEEEEEDKHQEREEEKQNQEEEEEEKENQADLMELQSVEDLLSTTQHNKNQELMEFPLVDVPAPVRRPDEKLLIDLSNTPDLVRNHSAKPCGGQLIDLSSPLIKWSPEEKQGNTGVLVNISF
ncbi:unnamed protein product [Boreogadus saida]